MLEKTYALRIANKDFQPHFREGWTLYLQEGMVPEEIREGDYVAYCRENGRACLRQVAFSESGQVILKALAVNMTDLVIPREHLKLCHKVINIKLI